MASTALGIVGAGIGSMFGMPGLGYMVGSALGSAMFPPPGQDGPRLTDLKVQDSTYGGMIPIVYNIMRISGTVIWADDLKEHAHSEGGSGGGGATSYSYTCSFAVSICEGTKGVRKIWADGKLIYDVDVLRQHYTATSLVFYTGTEDQLPDPTIEAKLGVGNVPAYRGQVYAVFTDLELSKYGNRIPNLTFEVGPIAQPTYITEIIDPVSIDLGGWDNTYPGSTYTPMPYVSSTGKVWQFTQPFYTNKKYFPKGYFAILDPSQDMKVVGYTSNETGMWLSVSMDTTYNAPPASLDSAFAPNYSPPFNIKFNEYLLVGGAPSGSWAGHAGNLARLVNGTWEFVVPTSGMYVVDYSASSTYHFDGTSWNALTSVTYSNEYYDPTVGTFPYYADYHAGTDTVVTYSDYDGMWRKYNGTTGACILEYLQPYILLGTYKKGPFGPMAMDQDGSIWWLYEDGSTAGHILNHVSRTDFSVSSSVDVDPAGAHQIDGLLCVGSTHVFVVSGKRNDDGSTQHKLTAVEKLTGALTFIDTLTAIPYPWGQGLNAMAYDSNRNHLHYYKATDATVGGLTVTVIDATAMTAVATFNQLTTPNISSLVDNHGGYSSQETLVYDPATDAIWGRTIVSEGPPKSWRFMAFDPVTYDVVMQSDVFSTDSLQSLPTVIPNNIVIEDESGGNAFAHFQWGAGTVDNLMNLGEIVADISTRTQALTMGQINVDELTDDVLGYALASRMTGRSAIEPLSTAYFFDAVESSGKVKFVKRGAAPVVTIESNLTVLEDQQ
jgi:hypothetical protein